jgi:hypothetical protein
MTMSILLVSFLKHIRVYNFFHFAGPNLLRCNKRPVQLRTSVLFCMHLLSPPPSEKVDLPQAARFGAFFLPVIIKVILFFRDVRCLSSLRS